MGLGGRIFFSVGIGALILARQTVVDYYFNRYYILTEYGNRLFEFLPYETNITFIYLIYNFSFILTLLSYIRVSFSDPGYVPKDIQRPSADILAALFTEKEIEKQTCRKCHNSPWKPPRAYHCSTCKKCVMRMDHHCGWVNNCVGLKNLKFFIIFNAFACMQAVFTVILLAYTCIFYFQLELPQIIYNLQDQNDQNEMQSSDNKENLQDGNDIYQKIFYEIVNPSVGKIQCSFIISISIFFTLFTLSFLTEQLERMEDNQSQVEMVKKQAGKQISFTQGFTKIFGSFQKQGLSFFNIFSYTKGQSNYLEKTYSVKVKQNKDQCCDKNVKSEQQMENKGSKIIEDLFNDKDHKLYLEFQKFTL